MFLKRIKNFILDIYNKKELLIELVKRDFQKQYMGSYLGFIWVYLQPLLFVFVIYVIFNFGLKGSNSIDNTPFIVHLTTGMVVWFYISGNLNTNTSVIKNHSFLLKKIDFRLSMLPIVNLISSFASHLFLIFIAVIVALLNGMELSIYIFQLVYYFISMSFLLLGIGWLTSSTQLFISDVSKIMALVVTFGFWLTPIFWDIHTVPQKYQWMINLNPFTYIVQGYRDSIYLNIAFWEKPYEMLYFWSITILFLLIGILVFKRLRPHFAEVV